MQRMCVRSPILYVAFVLCLIWTLTETQTCERTFTIGIYSRHVVLSAQESLVKKPITTNKNTDDFEMEIQDDDDFEATLSMLDEEEEIQKAKKARIEEPVAGKSPKKGIIENLFKMKVVKRKLEMSPYFSPILLQMLSNYIYQIMSLVTVQTVTINCM